MKSILFSLLAASILLCYVPANAQMATEDVANEQSSLLSQLTGSGLIQDAFPDLDKAKRRKRGQKGGMIDLPGNIMFPSFSVAMPMGDFADIVDIGIGGTISGHAVLNRILLGSYGSVGIYPRNRDLAAFGFDDKQTLVTIGLQVAYIWAFDELYPYAGLGGTLNTFFGDDDINVHFGFAPVGGIIYAISDVFYLHGSLRLNQFYYKYEYLDGNSTVKETQPYSTFNFNIGIGFPFTPSHFSHF